MRRLLSHRSAQSLVAAVIAVVLALGGTALATSGSGRSSDASAVAAKKKKHKRPPRVVRRYVARYVKHHPGPRGRRGPEGTKGATGGTGPAGQDATAVTGYVVTPLVQMDPDDNANITAVCPAGFVPTGGGFDYADYGSGGNYEGDDKNIQVSTSSPIDDDLNGVNDGWFVYARNFGDNPDARARAYAACAAGDATTSQIRHARAVFARQPALKLHR